MFVKFAAQLLDSSFTMSQEVRPEESSDEI